MRYIDADELIERIKNMPWKMGSASEITKFIFLSTVAEAPTADVVPKGEVEKLLHKCDECAGRTQWKCDCANIELEVAREIFEEIERTFNAVLVGDISDILKVLATLKKKYTEGEHNE